MSKAKDKPRAKSNSRGKHLQESQSGGQTGLSANDGSLETVSRYVCEQVKQLRKRKGWTLEQLSTLSGVSRSMLSQIERGSANPTLAVAFRIAQAFDVSLGDLVDGVCKRPKIEVIRSDDETSVFRDDEKCRIKTLSPLNLEKDVEFYEVVLRPGQTLDSAAHFTGTREFLTVQQGRVKIQSGDESTILKKGDSAQYIADVDHSIENVGKSDAIFFLVDIYSNEG